MIRKVKEKIRTHIENYPFILKIYQGIADIKYQILKIVPDRYYIPLLYRMKTGNSIDLKNPKTLSDKVNWLKLHYRSNYKIKRMTDKASFREEVEKLGYGKNLTPLYGVYESTSDIDWNSMSKGTTYYIKTSHDSGTVMKYIHGKDNNKKIIKTLKKRMDRNYYYYSREWNYDGIKPKILIEYDISRGNDLEEYKFFCIEGVPIFVFCYREALTHQGIKKTNPEKSIVDLNQTPLNFTMGKKSTKTKQTKVIRTKWDEMIKLSTLLAKDFPFVRVDFLYNGDKVYVGELTFFSSGGNFVINPKRINLHYGKMLNLKKYME